MQKPSEALPSQVFQVVAKVIKEQRAGKGHIRSQKGTVPLVTLKRVISEKVSGS